MKISIIIKMLNEEDNIARAIESSLKAIDGLKGEVIIADSGSTDKSIEIAKKYPVTIIQLKNTEKKSCGIGAELGYQNSSGEYLYILDADMVLDRGFIKKAIPILEKDSLIAGIGGKINEMTNSNIIFQKRKSFHESEFKEDEYVDKLMMGGIYKRSAIEKVEYFSNQCLHSYEESDLGYRLKLAGFKLKRVPLQMITHYGDNKSSMQIIKDRWKSKYLWGCGEFLRQNILKKTFINAAFEVRLYLTVIFLWLLILICLAISPITPLPLSILILFLLSSSLLLIIRKKNIIEYLFSIFSWNITAIGLICGFINGQGDPKKRIEIKKIK